MHSAASSNAIGSIKVLISINDRSFIDLKNHKGETAIMLAVRYGHFEAFKILFEKKANISN